MTTTDGQFAPQAAQRAPWTTGWDRAECQRIWLGTQTRPWQSLAVVPGDEGISTSDVANLLTALGLHHGQPIGFVDMRETGLESIGQFFELAGWHASRGERLVFATRTIRENLATIPLARSADAAVLCVTLGTTSIDLATQTIDIIGRERFLGSILVPPHSRERFVAPMGLEPRRLPGQS